MTEPETNEVETVFEIVKDSFLHLITKPGIILMSVLLLLVVWGPKGQPIFMGVFNGWLDADPLSKQFKIQMISYSSGIVLLVVIPMLLIKLRFHERLSDYGLGAGNVKLGLTFFAVVVAISLPLFYLGAKNPTMQANYPMIYVGMTVEQIKQVFNWRDFLTYEIIYASFFFVIEFVFRGYMLFGLREKFGAYAILIQMLSYTAWHLCKPIPELVTTPVWGFAVAAVALRVRSVWYVFAAHWLLNIFLDVMILKQLHVI
jgi:membrane protease YdiL (CAAX protease family)